MTSKRSNSPGPINLMKEIMRLIAEPNSVNNKKKTEVNCFQRPRKVINHDYCDECSGGGEIICCDKCPKSYHINCHIPTVNKLPDGEWFCKGCTYNENDNFNYEVPINGDSGKTVNEYTCHYNYTDQDRFKMGMLPNFVNKIENCDTSKCTIFKNFNASMRKIMELESPYYVIHEFLNEIPIQRKYNVKLPARKQLDKQKMLRKNDRCFICKRGILRGRLVQCHYCCRLYHLNCLDPPIRDWDHSMRWICPEHNKFYELAYPEYFTPSCKSVSDIVTMKRARCEFPKLTVNTFFNIPSHIDAMYKKPEENVPIASTQNSSLNILCDIASFELESINSNQNTNKDNIAPNDISAKFLARQFLNKIPEKNCMLPKQPTVSLSCLSVPINIPIHNSLTIGKSPNNNFCLLSCGNCEYVSDLHATITYDEKLGDYLVNNHSRYGLIVDNVSYFGRHRPKDLSNSKFKKLNYQVNKYINKRRRYLHKNNYIFRIYQKNEGGKLIIKYITKSRKFDYRSMYKYYTSLFKNTNQNYRQIQCKCSNRLIPKDGYAEQAVLHNGSIISIGCIKFKFIYDFHIKEDSKFCTKELVSKEDGLVENKPLNISHLKSQCEQENNDIINKDIGSKTVFVTINDHYPLEDVEETNYFNEQNNISTFHLNNFNDHNFSNDNTIDCVPENIIMHNNKVKPMSDINLSSLSNIHWDTMNGVSDKIQSCFGDDSVHDVEIINPSEENMYNMNYIDVENSTAGHICNVDGWLMDGVLVNELSDSDKISYTPLTGSYSIEDRNLRNSRTEHLYCAKSPNELVTIIISDSDE